MRPLAAVGFLLLLAGVAAGLAQLWFAPWSPETFVKLAISDGAILVVLIVAASLIREKRESDRTRDDALR